ncbi:MAG: hypothetical protein HY725_11760 [Candidatus Rokubacteria bacterium]|nr:hypothetical protein [Candidatus Rokubacteria bacterium]
MMGNHSGWHGRRYRRVYLDFLAELGPFGDLARMEAARVAALRVQLEVATAALVDAQRSRRDGKGRRPSVQAVERAARRAGLADGSYSQALDKLRELAGERRPTPDELLDRVHKAMRREARAD